MMKKLISTLLLSILVLSLSACGNTSIVNNTSETSSINNKAVSEVNSKSSQDDTVVVPDVVGMDKDEAVAKLEGLGFVVKTETQHLTCKDINNTSLGFYDDNYVLDQDSKSGTVMVKGSNIKLTYNSNTSQFEYTVNDDGTITLTNIKTTYCPNQIFQIPEIYDQFSVSTINANLIKDFNTLYPQITIKIPQKISIIGEVTVPVEYY